MRQIAKHILLTFAIIICATISYAENLSLNFYGHNLKITTVTPNNNLINNFISNTLTTALQSILVEPTINELDNYSLEFNLDDIAYLQLVKKVAALYTTNIQSQKLFTYKLLKQKGYRVLLAYSNCGVNVYGQTSVNLFNTLLVNHNNLSYYDLYFSNLEPTLTETMLEEELPNARAFVLNEGSAPNLNAKQEKYNLHFEFEGFDYSFSGMYNKSLALYFNDLPDIAFSSVYLNYGVSEIAKKSLVQQLKNAVYGMHANKALSFILKFTQDAFPYKNDLANDGREKFAFPEELLANPNADCEDKSVMFAYLVREVLNLKSLALIYYSQNHFNVAVANSNNFYKGHFKYNQQQYLVCEPSGTNFLPGENTYDIQKASIIEW